MRNTWLLTVGVFNSKHEVKYTNIISESESQRKEIWPVATPEYLNVVNNASVKHFDAGNLSLEHFFNANACSQ